MFTLELDKQQVAMLHEILEMFLTDLRGEISHTDSSFFREGLKKKEVFLKDVLGRLRAAGE